MEVAVSQEFDGVILGCANSTAEEVLKNLLERIKPMETNKMQLLTTKNFNGVAFDCYKAENENDGFWATREQIGQLLKYKNPAKAIKDIHIRHRGRLDKFSRVAQIALSSGGLQEMILYSFKGFLEICRFSNQPKADAVIDFAWNIMEEIRKTGSYTVKGLNVLNIRTAELLKDIAQYASKDEQRKIIKEAFKLATGHELL